MNFVCPSCAASNRVPDKAAGIVIICRRCKTQVTAPGDPNRKARPWFTSPRWMLIILLELAAVSALVAAVLLVVRRELPAGIPLIETAGAPQVAVPGGTLRFEWQADQEAVGGYHRFTSQNVSLLRPGIPPRAVAVRGEERPWPESLLEAESLPDAKPVRIALELEMPAEYALSGQRVTLQAAIGIEYPGRATPEAAPALQEAMVGHQETFVVATEAEGHAFQEWRTGGKVLHGLVIGCALLAVVIPIAAVALAQQRISIMCPKCGRGCAAVFYHEGGEIYISPCPHRGGPRTDAYDD